MTQSKVFKSNKSQTIRLPKPVAFPDTVEYVEIVKLGKSRLITPVGARWDDFFHGPPASDDFMAERGQPEQQNRDPL